MSLRSVKKLKEASKTQDQQNDKQIAEALEEEEEQPKVQKLKNNFAAFGAFDNDDDDDEDETETNEKEAKESEPKADGKEGEKANQAKKNKKKKNKKKKVAPSEGKEGDEEEKIDRTGKDEKSKDEGEEEDEEESKEESKDLAEDGSCLSLNLRAFNYNKELSKAFKNTKLTGEADKPNMEGLSKRQKAMMKMMKDRNNRNFRNFNLVYGDVAFMQNPERFVCEQKSINEFKKKVFALKPTTKYASQQESYLNLKNGFDPQIMIDFVQQNPYHAEALFDAAEFFRLRGDYKQANQLFEKVLFVLEDSLSYEFKVFEENDSVLAVDEYSIPFFKSLNRFIDVLGKKGCYKSAFEFNKFLVKLNPYEDPAGGILTLDYHAISIKNYKFVERFATKFGSEFYYNTKFSVFYLPNYIYSTALAKFLEMMENNEKLTVSDVADFTKTDFDKATKPSYDHSKEGCNVILLTAILLYPGIIKNLIEVNDFHKQTVSLGSKFTNWQKKTFKEILAHSLFTTKHEPLYSCLGLQNNADIEGMNKVLEIYVERSKMIWKNNQVMMWVKAAIGFILNQFEELNFQYDDFVEKLVTGEFCSTLPFELSRYKNLRKQNFSDSTERLDLANIPDQIGAAQQQQNPNFNPVNTNQSLLGMLISSLLPWNHIPPQQQQQQPQNFDEINPDDFD